RLAPPGREQRRPGERGGGLPDQKMAHAGSRTTLLKRLAGSVATTVRPRGAANKESAPPDRSAPTQRSPTSWANVVRGCPSVLAAATYPSGSPVGGVPGATTADVTPAQAVLTWLTNVVVAGPILASSRAHLASASASSVSNAAWLITPFSSCNW